MSNTQRPSRACTATGLLVLALLAFASPSAAEDLLICEDAHGRKHLTHPPCPPGTTYVRRMPSDSSAPVGKPPVAPGKILPEGAENPLDPADAARVARAMRAARFQRAVTGLYNLRMYAMAHYDDTGEWATKPKQLGLDPKTLFDEDIAAIEFRSDGTIEAKLRPEFGDGKRVWIRPKTTLGGAQMRWECGTNLGLPKLLGFREGQCHPTWGD